MADRLVTSDSRTAHGSGVVRYAERRRGLPCRAPDVMGVRCSRIFGPLAHTVDEIRAAAEERDAHELLDHGLVFTTRVETVSPDREKHVRGGRARWRRGGIRP